MTYAASPNMVSQIKGLYCASLPGTMVPPRRIGGSIFTVASPPGRREFSFTRKTFPIQSVHHQPQKQLVSSPHAQVQSKEKGLMRSLTLEFESSKKAEDQMTESLLKASSFNTKPKEIQQYKLDGYQILKHALITDKAMKNIIENNTLVFVVDVRASKANIKDAFETMFKIRTKSINTLSNFRRTKKAYITLAPDYKALDVAKKIKII